MVKILKGSIFDSKCDLLIIPCNNHGGIAPSIAQKLSVSNIPKSIQYIETGSVIYIENIEGFYNSSVVGYAASVEVANDETFSNELIIQQIMRSLKIYCKGNSICRINMPLLGTGAGGLSEKVSYNIIAEYFSESSDITVCIYIPKEEVFQGLCIEEKYSVPESIPPRVFISYTGIDEKKYQLGR